MFRLGRLSRKEVGEVMKAGKSLHFEGFSVRTAVSRDIGLKVAFTATKKIFPLAVERNKARRRSREALKRVIGEIKPISAVFFLKKSILTSSFANVTAEFSKMYAKI